MSTHHRAIKQVLDKARTDYLRAIAANDLKASQEASKLVRELQADLSAELTQGANPCPFCGQAPHGIEHPSAAGGFVYEVGCLTCKPFRHTDGTNRWARCKGGLIPSQTVEAWNAGPDYWLLYTPR